MIYGIIDAFKNGFIDWILAPCYISWLFAKLNDETIDHLHVKYIPLVRGKLKKKEFTMVSQPIRLILVD